MTDSATLRRILEESRSIAIVGLSDKPHRPSHGVGRYLLDHGYEIVPVNPMHETLLGQRCYPSLEAIGRPVDLVDCFRRSEEMPAIAREAVRIGAKVLWMQLGVVDEEAAEIARAGGLQVVMDRCTEIEHARLLGGPGRAAP